MRKVTIVFTAILLASLLTDTATVTGQTSRFLAAHAPNWKKCHMNPSVCKRIPNTTCCGLQCVNMSSDVFNCGKCGKICKFTQSCCGGKCVDLIYDKRHCGSCFNKCKKGVRCFYGLCNYA